MLGPSGYIGTSLVSICMCWCWRGHMHQPVGRQVSQSHAWHEAASLVSDACCGRGVNGAACLGLLGLTCCCLDDCLHVHMQAKMHRWLADSCRYELTSPPWLLAGYGAAPETM